MNDALRGQPLAIDGNAKSASSHQPAFITPPKGAPVYYGFVILEDVVVEGFRLGKITDFEAEPCDTGDAFVIAPDDSRAGLIWEFTANAYFNEVLAPEPSRWGVWGVGFTIPMTSRENAKKNLSAILPMLKCRWAGWKSRYK